jgi:hypothetical protein
MATAEAVLSSLISEPGVSDIPSEAPAELGLRVQPIQEAPVRTVVERFSQQQGQPQDAIPENFYFGGLHDPALKLQQPIPVRTERSAEGITVIWDEISEFGFGRTFSEAVEDFGRTVFELYKSLLEDDLVLGSDLIEVRNRLTAYIAVRPR